MSKIEWTDVTWNPVTGCDKVSQGCKNCYAEVMHRRLRGMYPKKYSLPFLGHIQLHPDELDKPMQWKLPRMIFVNSMSDLFHKDVPFEFINAVFSVIHLSPQHTFQILTKRPERMKEYFNSSHFGWAMGKVFSNAWLGVSCEDQKTANERIPFLLDTPAAVRFVSVEPLLGPINLTRIEHSDFMVTDSLWKHKAFSSIHWVICGGESGHNARPMHPDWARSLRDQCNAAGVPFLFKQWGEWEPDSHVSFNGPFLIQGKKHQIVNIDGRSYPYIDFFDPAPDECPLTKEDNAYWMAKTGKKRSGNLLDGKQHLEFPKARGDNSGVYRFDEGLKTDTSY